MPAPPHTPCRASDPIKTPNKKKRGNKRKGKERKLCTLHAINLKDGMQWCRTLGNKKVRARGGSREITRERERDHEREKERARASARAREKERARERASERERERARESER